MAISQEPTLKVFLWITKSIKTLLNEKKTFQTGIGNTGSGFKLDLEQS